MLNILVIHGPNLQLLGQREPAIYGTDSLETINGRIREKAGHLGARTDFFQSNSEGELVGRIGEAMGRYDGIIINPAAYTHTSLALHDALKAVAIPAIEVHLSHIAGRESFRHTSLTAPACVAQIAGLGSHGYLLALEGLIDYISRARSANPDGNAPQ